MPLPIATFFYVHVDPLITFVFQPAQELFAFDAHFGFNKLMGVLEGCLGEELVDEFYLIAHLFLLTPEECQLFKLLRFITYTAV